MLNSQEKYNLIKSIHGIPMYEGCMIGLYEDVGSELLHGGKKGTSGYMNYLAIVEVQTVDDLSIVFSGKGIEGLSQDAIRNSKVKSELANTGLNCFFAVASGAGIVTTSAASGATGGTSLLLTVAMWGGFVTSTAQCTDGLYKLAMMGSGRWEELKEVETNSTYILVTEIVDGWDKAFGVMSIAGNITKLMILKQGIKKFLPANYNTLKKGAKKIVVFDSMKKMFNEPNGEKLIREALKEAGRNESSINNTISGLRKGISYVSKFEKVEGNLLKIESEKLTKQIADNWKDLRNDIRDFSTSLAQDGIKKLEEENEKVINVNVINLRR